MTDTPLTAPAEPAACAAARAAALARRQWLAGAALAAAAAVCFSLRPVLVKLAYGFMADPVTLLTLRMLLSLPFFVVAAIWHGRSRPQARLSAGDLAAVLVLGFLGYYLASYLDFLGLQYVSAGVGRLILFLYPTIVLLLSALLLRTRVRGREVAALAVSYGGLALVLLPAHDGTDADLPLGAALVFASGVAYAIYLIGGTRVIGRLGSIRFSALATSVACLCCFIQFLALRPLTALTQPFAVYALSAVIAIVCTVAPIFMTSEALRRIGANNVAIINALGPASAMLWGYVALDEAMSGVQVGGAALVLAGVLLVTWKPQRG
jgi:drug/metabolite transporter (DMT)-like permease